MGMERMADYPGSVLWRASLFTTTLGLHGFAHLHPSTHVHTHSPIAIHKDIFIDTRRFGCGFERVFRYSLSLFVGVLSFCYVQMSVDINQRGS